MGVRRKSTLRLGGRIFKSYLLATVQNHGGGGSGPMPASPRPLGSGAKYKKKITNTESGGGSGKSINCVGQGQAPLTGSHSHPEFSKVQIVKIYNPSGLLTKIKSHVPNEPKRQLEGQQRSEKRQVEMVREKQAEKKTEGERRSRKRQQETGRRDRLPRSFQKQCFQFNGMALGANVTWTKAAEALTLSRARTHTPIYNIFIYT